MLTSSQLQNLIIVQVGDTPDGVLSLNMSTLWEMSSQYSGFPALQFLYVKKAAISTLMGRYRAQVNFSSSGDLTVSLDNLLGNLIKMLALVDEEIAQAIVKSRSGKSSVGELETKAPAPSPYPNLDGNDPGYRGSIYKRSRLGNE